MMLGPMAVTRIAEFSRSSQQRLSFLVLAALAEAYSSDRVGIVRKGTVCRA